MGWVFVVVLWLVDIGKIEVGIDFREWDAEDDTLASKSPCVYWLSKTP